MSPDSVKVLAFIGAIGAFVAAGLLPDMKEYLVPAGTALLGYIVRRPGDITPTPDDSNEPLSRRFLP